MTLLKSPEFAPFTFCLAIRHSSLFLVSGLGGFHLLAAKLAPAEHLSPLRKLFFLRLVGLAVPAADDFFNNRRLLCRPSNCRNGAWAPPAFAVDPLALSQLRSAGLFQV